METTWPALLGHGFADAGPFPVPLPILLPATVGIAVAAAAARPRDSDTAAALPDRSGPRTTTALRVLAVVMVAAVAVPAAFGQTDISRNPAPQLLFTVGWAGVLLTSALFGGWWRVASPLQWAAGGTTSGPAEGLGIRPAAVALVVFSAAEHLVSPTPLLVVSVVGVYIVVGVGVAVLRGGAWGASSDPLEAASRAVGSMAPLGRSAQDALAWRSPRAGVSAAAAPAGLAAFLGVLIGANLFDASVGHLSGGDAPYVFAAMVAGSAGAVVAVAKPISMAVAFIPAAAAHVAAHYLAPLLIEGQVAVIQASDPFGVGWNLLGLTGRDIVAEPVPPVVGMGLQLLFLVAGHALAIVVAGDVAARDRTVRAARAAAFPVRAALVASLAAGVYLRLG